MGRRHRDYKFWDTAYLNNRTFCYYFDRLKEIAISVFEWKNLPPTIDERFLELTLFEQGQAVIFQDDVLGMLGLRTAISGKWNVYNIPVKRRAYASNGYNRNLTIDNSVVVFNSRLRKPMNLDTELFARRLAELDRAIDVNTAAQKTPVLLKCPEKQRLSMQQVYKEYTGNAPVIFGEKAFDTDMITVVKTDAPLVAPQLYDLKGKIWNEALNYLGVASTAVEKRERVNVHETDQTLAGVMASRFSRLEARREAAEKVNKMFGLNIEVDFRDVAEVYDLSDVSRETISEGGETTENE